MGAHEKRSKGRRRRRHGQRSRKAQGKLPRRSRSRDRRRRRGRRSGCRSLSPSINLNSNPPHLHNQEQRHASLEQSHASLEKSEKPFLGRRKAQEGVDWRCGQCNFLNYDWRMQCYLCKENKPLSYIIEPEKAPGKLNPGKVLGAWKM